MSFGVKGLHAGDVDRENRKPTIEGLSLREGTKKMKETRSVLPGVNGLHAGGVDREMASQPLKAYRR